VVLRSLRLQDFRCFTVLDLEVPESGAILIGNNAQGKTSILEALCLLIRLHSPRTHRIPALARHGQPRFGVAGNPWNQERTVRWSNDGLAMQCDGATRPGKSAYLADGGLVVWMGNEDLELVRGPGECRRHYLDFIGAQMDPAYRRAWSRYRRALRAKNLLLKEGRPRDSEIRSYEEIMVENGSALTESRTQMVAALSPLITTSHTQIGGTDEAISLHYLPASGPDMRESILQAREREFRLRQSVVGPHRDELALRIHGMPASEFASEGQQRTLALALKLAQGRFLESSCDRLPIYLMDDVFGELDPTRRNALMSHLPPRAQKWITTTHLDWWKESDGFTSLARYQVQRGLCQ
jgi:DNA replication and repair protein RecF